jgi:hypothetical protein
MPHSEESGEVYLGFLHPSEEDSILRPVGRYLQASTAHVKEVARRLGLENAKSVPTPETESL